MSKRILIVDDSQVSRRLVRRCIEFAGFGECEFLEAGDGANALEMIEAGKADVLITDLNMPVMDGLELLRAIHESGAPKPILTIVMTSAASTALKAELDKYQVAALITKPVSHQAFAKALAPLHTPRAQG
jgi:two-component system chemotaxis response regulator CheY